MQKLLIIFGLLHITACQPESRVYSDYKELSPDYEWLKKDVKIFKIPMGNISSSYKMNLSFRYVNGYQYQFAKVLVKEVSPSGKTKIKNYALKIRDDNGKYIGDAGYDIWDSEHIVESNKLYQEIGEYTYFIEHEMPFDTLNFAMEIGILLDKNPEQ